MTWNRKHLAAGTRVKLNKGMGVKQGNKTHVEGVIQSRDGEYYYVAMDFEWKCICERYLNEIDQALIAGQWVAIR